MMRLRDVYPLLRKSEIAAGADISNSVRRKWKGSSMRTVMAAKLLLPILSSFGCVENISSSQFQNMPN